MLNRFFAALLFALLVVPQVHAVNPDEVLDDPALEERARSLSAELRCLVCQNQSIDDSDATLARDLRVLVREKLTEGLSDREILDFLVSRYGEFVLLKPKISPRTYLLWGAPLVLILIGFVVFWRYTKVSAKIDLSEDATLSKTEQERLTKLLDE